ncbi:PucR family transcriptional regulator ligand-binding domain-containing protein [Hoyosella sp. YIM 151337]|uniref:PucR family transcriptional regulator n=1 Tax=Hoyosella sp. YIM 151337 TaxID=2992742 RepID=UPI002235641C|nr:PucR family transcriptional regulator [Hoyosella sp. YIM 151337]MCW4355464.1 PucR family transcriptional regulator ligand-binding domain-containing protein [Hoyosella sp. YIM 151337]
MGVPVKWVLQQPDLALELRGGAAGVDRSISLVLTTELEDPFRWLSGGELVLTTGITLPLSVADRAEFVHQLRDKDVAALGFGTGLSHPQIPAGLTDAADEAGLPLFEVPLPTPFAAIHKKVMTRIAELQYDSVLRASRAQPRMTRAAVQGGITATLRELAAAVGGTALFLDPSGRLSDSQPRAAARDAVEEVSRLVHSGKATSRVSVLASGASVAVQTIAVGSSIHGYLAVVSPVPLGNVEQILLGHANSLLALDFEKPVRLRAAQNTLNSTALGLLLTGHADKEAARVHVRGAADSHGHVRAFTITSADENVIESAAAAVDKQLTEQGRPVYTHRSKGQLLVALRGTDTAEFAQSLLQPLRSEERKATRCGLSSEVPADRLSDASSTAALAASAAEYGGTPLEFAQLTGQALLTFPQTREVLAALADTLIRPLAEHDAQQGTELLPSLRAFLEANGHWESAAATLGVHRHTLRNRIARTEAILRCDLSVARVRAELLLGLIVRQS